MNWERIKDHLAIAIVAGFVLAVLALTAVLIIGFWPESLIVPLVVLGIGAVIWAGERIM